MKTPQTISRGLRILMVSDFIDPLLKEKISRKDLPDIDLIISCGDLAPEYLSFLRDRLDCPLYYVKGNHDIRYSGSNPVGCQNIHRKIVRFKSLNILGLEGSIWYNGGINQFTDKEMRKMISSMWFSIWRRGGLDMVITHAPPRHIHDAEDRCHIGFESFVNLIKKYKPAYFVHGHIHREFQHPSERVTLFQSTKVINTCGYHILEV